MHGAAQGLVNAVAFRLSGFYFAFSTICLPSNYTQMPSAHIWQAAAPFKAWQLKQPHRPVVDVRHHQHAGLLRVNSGAHRQDGGQRILEATGKAGGAGGGEERDSVMLLIVPLLKARSVAAGAVHQHQGTRNTVSTQAGCCCQVPH